MAKAGGRVGDALATVAAASPEIRVKRQAAVSSGLPFGDHNRVPPAVNAGLRVGLAPVLPVRRPADTDAKLRCLCACSRRWSESTRPSDGCRMKNGSAGAWLSTG